MTPSSFIDSYIDEYLGVLEVERRASAYTIRNYRTALENFAGFLTTYRGARMKLDEIESLSARDIRAFLAERKSGGLGAASLRLDLSALKSFARFLERRYEMKCTAIFAVRGPKLPKRLPRPVSPQAARDIIDAAQHRGGTWEDKRDAALFTLIYGCGLRISEALALKWRDRHITQSILIMGKGGKHRRVPLLPLVEDAIKAYIEALLSDMTLSAGGIPNFGAINRFDDNSRPLFFSSTGRALSARACQLMMEKIRPRLGLPESATPHALRHAFASHILAGSGDLRAVQELLGHNALSSTQKYTEITTAHLMQSYENARPKRRARVVF